MLPMFTQNAIRINTYDDIYVFNLKSSFRARSSVGDGYCFFSQNATTARRKWHQQPMSNRLYRLPTDTD
jgi:hypothetical protein